MQDPNFQDSTDICRQLELSRQKQFELQSENDILRRFLFRFLDSNDSKALIDELELLKDNLNNC